MNTTHCKAGAFCIGTAYFDGLKTIELTHQRHDGSDQTYDLTAMEKVDNPVVVCHANRVFAAWEHYDTDTRIMVSVIDPNTLQKGEFQAFGVSSGRCYRPRLSSDGTDLVLSYEQFAGGHYVIIGRLWLGNGFSESFELGGGEGNNQEPWLEAGESGFLLSYENSRPLYKDYVWVSPSGSKVIIPGFGHGWRVETRSFLKRVTVRGNRLYTSVLKSPEKSGSERGRILPITDESAGCPRAIPLKDGAVLVVYCGMGDRIWEILYSHFDGEAWNEPRRSGLIQQRRVPPQAEYCPQRDLVLLYGEDSDTGEPCSLEISVSPDIGNMSPSPEDDFADETACAPYTTTPRETTTREISYQDRTLRLLWGDLHMHSNLSPCSLHPKFHCVELEEKFRHSRDVGGLDFAMCTDHDTMSDAEWERTKTAADFNNIPGSFTAFQGFEWTATHGPGPKIGHYNVLYRDSGRLFRVSEEDGNHITKLWKVMKKGEVLTIPHHPADETHTLDWRFFDPDFEPLVEIFQVRGSYEYPGNSMDPSRYRPEKMVDGASILEALEKGYQFGFTSGGEHEGVGITAVFASDNTRDSIFDALVNRRVYGTTGDRIFMDFRVNGTLMGGHITGMTGNPELYIHIDGTAPVEELRIMRDGQKIYSRGFAERHVEMHWIDDSFSGIADEREVHYYYVAVEQENGEIGWASPVFIEG